MREIGVDLLGRLSIAFSHCMCTGRWGAIWSRLIFPASFRIPSNCCLDPFVVAPGLPSGSHIHSAYLFGWVSTCDRACLDRTQAAGERSLYIPRQASATGKIFIHHFFIIFSTGTSHRISLSLLESLTCRLVFDLLTGIVDIQHGSKPGMESSGQPLQSFPQGFPDFPVESKRLLKIL